MYKLKTSINNIDINDLINKYYNREVFVEMCKECPNYAKLWSCPPYDFDNEKYVRKYKRIYIIAVQIIFDSQTIDTIRTQEEIKKYTYETLHSVRNIVGNKLMLLEEQYIGSTSLYAGSCITCSQCNRHEGNKCRHIETMRYSLESLGFDVGKISEELLNIEIKWSSDTLPEYFTLVSGFMTDEKICNIKTLFDNK